MKKIIFLILFVLGFNFNDLSCMKRKHALETPTITKGVRKYLYDPSQESPFRLSRSKIELFMQCPRCFYLHNRFGIKRPSGFPFNLNNAVDELLKKEFDIYREKGEQHPLFIENGLENVIPFKHDNLDKWRDSLHRGIEYKVPDMNLKICGGIDDVWITKDKQLIIVDYKATSKKGKVNLDANWQISYKRQIEIYQWLFRKNGFDVLDAAYFVYCNSKTDVCGFDKKLMFDISLILYNGNDCWIDDKIKEIYNCLQSNEIPDKGVDLLTQKQCFYCTFAEKYNEVLVKHY